MTTRQDAEVALGPIRDALFKACREAHDLAEATETLESVYSTHKGPINPGYFRVASTMFTGREVDDLEGNEKRIPHRERAARAEAIEAVLSLRAAIDHAIDLVGGVSKWMDSPHESIDRRWTTRTVEELRELRGAILRGHTVDAFPSALPMIRAKVPTALRKSARAVSKRMEEVKSAILLGVQAQSSHSAMSTELLARLEAATSKLAAVAGGGDVESPSNLSDALSSPSPALTANQCRVLQTMARFDASRLVSSDVIAAEMDAAGRLSARTIGPIVRKLIEMQLAERPEGHRSGARLTIAGRRLAMKIAD